MDTVTSNTGCAPALLLAGVPPVAAPPSELNLPFVDMYRATLRRDAAALLLSVDEMH